MQPSIMVLHLMWYTTATSRVMPVVIVVTMPTSQLILAAMKDNLNTSSDATMRVSAISYIL